MRAGILEEREGEHDLVGDILRDPSLTEAQKQTLIQVYTAFCHENEGVLVPSPEADREERGAG